MLVALIAKDKPGALAVRQENRPAHVEYLKSGPAVQQAGPLLDDAGDMCGSLIILDVPDMDAAQDWVAGAPSIPEHTSFVSGIWRIGSG